MEDPHIRAEFEAHIGRSGAKSRMDPSLYEAPDGA
jgi:hypothetical protein